MTHQVNVGRPGVRHVAEPKHRRLACVAEGRLDIGEWLRGESPCKLLIIVLHPNREHRRDAYATLGSAKCLTPRASHRSRGALFVPTGRACRGSVQNVLQKKSG